MAISVPETNGQPAAGHAGDQRPLGNQGSLSNSEEHPSSTLGYDLEDHRTRLQMELMDDLQRLGVSKYLDLPQLVVMGEQSTGKSSVLQAVTEIPFPIGEGIFTRFATEIVLKRTAPNVPTRIEICIVPGAGETPEKREALKAWRPDGFDHIVNLDEASMRAIFEQAKDIIFEQVPSPSRRRNGSNGGTVNRLSSSTLQITRSGPKETNFAIVDIPGLVRGKSKDGHGEHHTAEHLVKKYLDNVRSIIVVVIDVVDLERHEIFDLISDLPDKESRVVGVINKCDTKQKQADGWVFDLIRNVNPTQSKYYLKEGWYGLRNRAAFEQEISDEERDRLENEFFAGEEWSSLDDRRLGRHHLKKALIKMRNNHIKRSIPELLSEIDKKLGECISRITQLGEPRTTPTAQFAMINKIATNYSKMATGAVDGHYKHLHSKEMYARKLIRDNLDAFQVKMNQSGFQKAFRTGHEDADLVWDTAFEGWAAKFMEVPTYAWIRNAVKGFRAMEDGDEVNPEVKAALWKEQTVSWDKISSESLSILERTVESVNQALFAKACPDSELLRKLRLWLQDDFQAAINHAKYELQRILEDEKGGVFTLNPLRTRKQIIYHEERIQAIKDQMTKKYTEMALLQAPQPAMNVNPVEAGLVINSLLNTNPELMGILNTHDNIAAYYDISLYRFIDNFALQVVERHLLGPKGPLRLFNSDYVTARLYGAEKEAALSDLASEEPDVARERFDLEQKRVSLEESRRRLVGFRMF